MSSLQVQTPRTTAAIARFSLRFTRSKATKILWVGAGFLLAHLIRQCINIWEERLHPLYKKRLLLTKMRKYDRRKELDPQNSETVYRYLERMDRLIDDIVLGKKETERSYTLYYPDTYRLTWLAERTQQEIGETRNLAIANKAMEDMYAILLKASQDLHSTLRLAIPSGDSDEDVEYINEAFDRVILLVANARIEARKIHIEAFEEMLAITRQNPVFMNQAESIPVIPS